MFIGGMIFMFVLFPLALVSPFCFFWFFFLPIPIATWLCWKAFTNDIKINSVKH